MFTTAALSFKDLCNIIQNLSTCKVVVEGGAKESDLGAASLHIGGELNKNVSHGLDTV